MPVCPLQLIYFIINVIYRTFDSSVISHCMAREQPFTKERIACLAALDCIRGTINVGTMQNKKSSQSTA